MDDGREERKRGRPARSEKKTIDPLSLSFVFKPSSKQPASKDLCQFRDVPDKGFGHQPRSIGCSAFVNSSVNRHYRGIG